MSHLRHKITSVLCAFLSFLVVAGLSLTYWDSDLGSLIECGEKAVLIDCADLVKDGPGETRNRHVFVERFLTDSIHRSGFLSLPEMNVTYIPLLSEDIPGKPEFVDYGVFLRVDSAMDETEVRTLLKQGQVGGWLTPLRKDLLSANYHDEFAVQQWLDPSQKTCWILRHEAAQGTWMNKTIWGLIAVTFVVTAWCTGHLATRLMSAPAHVGIGLLVALLITGGGSVLIMFPMNRDVLLNSVIPPLATTMVAWGAVCCLIFVARGLTLITNQANQSDEEEAQKLATDGAGITPQKKRSAADEKRSQEAFQISTVGFSVANGRGGWDDFLDIDVVSFRISHQPTDNGLTTRAFHVSVKGANEKVESVKIAETLFPGQDDPMQPFFARLGGNMARQAMVKIKEGDDFSGENWSISLGGLTIQANRLSNTHSLGAISAFEWIGDEYKVWVANKEEPVLTLTGFGENEQVLIQILPMLLTTKRPNNTQPLGRLLVEFGKGKSMLGGKGKADFQCFELGLKTKSKDEAPIVWMDVKQYITSGTNQHECQFVMRDGTERAFKMSATAIGAEELMSQMSTRLTDALVETRLRDLVESGSTPWCQNMVITLKGIMFSSANGAPTIPFELIENLQCSNEKIQLTVSEYDAIQFSATEIDAIVGYRVLEKIRSVVSPMSPDSPSRTTRS